jgi:hypothetical protein
MPRTCGICLLALNIGRPAAAQSSTDPPSTAWSIAAGRVAFSMEDVARTGPPVDASPIAWEGSGGGLTARYERTRPARLHRYDLRFSSLGRFAYETPVRTETADSQDAAWWLGGRYDYRRRMLSRVLPSWIGAGIGARALADLISMTQHAPPSIEREERGFRFGGAGVLSARLQRWRRFVMEVEWANGLRLAQVSQRHSAGTSAETGFGPGWLTETTLRAEAALTSHAALLVEYTRIGDGVLATHHGYAAQTSGLMAGVRYGR